MKLSKFAFGIALGLIVGPWASIASAQHMHNDWKSPEGYTVSNPFTGTVTSVNGTQIKVKGAVTVGGGKNEVASPNNAVTIQRTLGFNTLPDTKVTKGEDQPAKLADIEVGDTLVVTFTARDNSPIRKATEIVLTKADKSKPDKKK